ncbi:MAG: phosphate acyltransferase PlsX [Gemmatimonadaceae bacterium]
MARIALDAMGGDHAPQAPVAGALEALAELDAAHSVQLVGRPSVIEQELAQHGGSTAGRRRLEIIDAADVIEMTDKPSAVRGKPNSSMMIGLKLQADGKSDAFVSAGNTGAQMAASMLLLRLHAGLKRPAIATIFPTAKRSVVVLDSGANVDCSADELVQFARLGAVYAEDILGRKKPAVGLLSIGEEPEKGNTVTKEAHGMLAEATSGINFLGNVEGRDIPAGTSHHGDLDVVVCDGFVGNVILKFYEAVAPLMIRLLVKEGLSEQSIRKGLRSIDYAEHGGAPLLGVKGVSIICHGRSSPAAIKNAIKVAVQAVDSRMNEHIGRRLEQSGPAQGAA